MRAATRSARVLDRSGDPHRATATPIWQTATFAQESALAFSTYDYSRSGNPTRATLEAHLAALDGGVRALAYASGVAAVAAVLRRLVPGDEVLAHDDLYGGTWRLLRDVLAPRGIAVRPADLRDPAAAAAAWSARTMSESYWFMALRVLQRRCDLGESFCIQRGTQFEYRYCQGMEQSLKI